MELEGDRDGAGHRQRRERKEGRLYHDRVQLDLALVHCPSINGNNPEGETDKQTNNTCASNKGKQTNKQTSGGGTCGGAEAGGGVELHSMWSPICNASEYAEELWRCIREGMEFDTQGCTLTSPPF